MLDITVLQFTPANHFCRHNLPQEHKPRAHVLNVAHFTHKSIVTE